MQKEYQILCKKSNLHKNDIKRTQGLATKNELVKGRDEGELQRTKVKSRKTNQIIKRTKKIESKFDKSIVSPPQTSSNMSTYSRGGFK